MEELIDSKIILFGSFVVVEMVIKLVNVDLQFNSKEEAVAYANNNKIPYNINLPNIPKQYLKSYADNFSFKKTR